MLAAAPPAWAAFYGEAPELAARVAAGALPPVAERLPEVPLLLEPVEEIGRYGGIWRMGMRRVSDHATFIRTIGYENLMRWTPDWTGVTPNLARSVTANADATEFTFALRRGLRWSDGAPFTADDILFWYRDVLLEPALTAQPPAWLMSGGAPVTVEKVDGHAVRFRFDAPHGLFPQLLALPEGAEPTSFPRHVLAPLHPRHNPNADAEARAAGFKDWVERFVAVAGRPGTVDHASRWSNPALPTLNAWVLTDTYGRSDRLEAVRNPYYWKVDPAGHQLPYIDRVVFTLVEGKADVAALAKAGAIDMQSRHVANYVQEIRAAQPGYAEFALVDTDMNDLVIELNQTHADPVLRRIFQAKDFRVALSHAVDRPAVIAGVFGGRGQPYQAGPRPESTFYNPVLARQYLDYDPGRANALLDGVLGAARDAEGFRLRPDGRRLSFTVATVGDQRLKGLQAVQRYWRAVGLDVAVVDMDRRQFVARGNANAHDASAWGGDGGLDVLLYPIRYFPYNYDSYAAVAWAYWYSDRANPLAEEPPAPVREQMALYDRLKTTPDPAEQTLLMTRILEITAERFPAIGITLPSMRSGIVRRGFRNVPKQMPAAWTYPDPAPTNPSQYFISD
ncbi:MAG TPA: ABC transporter substrate-binding protein [Alphaproteobacteria bacterium]|nr:ABC transporter substrate-binding protein [Alphaproteobacteria bacterium]